MVVKRCFWCLDDIIYQQYHDNEWGKPCYDEQRMFEFLLLEGFQAGLSWITILKKRDRYKEVLFNFDPKQIAVMSDHYIEQLMLDEGIIRNRLKLNAARKNARAWLELEDPVTYLWSFIGGKPKKNCFKGKEDVPATSQESEAMSKALKKKGFSFVGPTICYAYMQAIGMVNDHVVDCDFYERCE